MSSSVTYFKPYEDDDKKYQFTHVVVSGNVKKSIQSPSQELYSIQHLNKIGIEIDKSWSHYASYPHDSTDTLLFRRLLQVSTTASVSSAS